VDRRVPRLVRHLELAEGGTRELVRALETHLDAAAAAGGELPRHLEPTVVDLGDVVRGAVAQARALTTRHRVTSEVPAAPLVVAGDRARLRQVLDNLLANAIKYAPDGGPINVFLEVAQSVPAALAPRGEPEPPHWALLRVEDAGLGIPAAEVPHVFERSRWAASTRPLGHGAGLGLYTCRAIVAAHGGHIWVERTATADEPAAPGQGTGGPAAGGHGTVMAVALPLLGAVGSGPAGPAARTATSATTDAAYE
jgi:signal transduction histidine kinase